jgi:hypothetical protein
MSRKDRFSQVKDKNNVIILEGHLLKVPHNYWMAEGIYKVSLYKGRLVASSIKFFDIQTANKYDLDFMVSIGAIVVGTVKDNPELLGSFK